MVAPLLRNNPGGVVSNAPFGTGGGLLGNNPGGVIANAGGPLLSGGGLPSGQIDWLANLDQLAQWLGREAARKIERLLRDQRTAAQTTQDLTNLAKNPGSVSVPDIISTLDDYYNRYFPAATRTPVDDAESAAESAAEGGQSPVAPEPATPQPSLPSFVIPNAPFGGMQFSGRKNEWGETVEANKGLGSFRAQYGTDRDLVEDQADKDAAYSGWETSAGNLPFGLRRWTGLSNQRGKTQAAYDRYRAENPSTDVRYAEFIGGWDPEKQWWLAGPDEAMRSNPFFRTRRL